MKKSKHKSFYCPNCKTGKMIFNKQSKIWICDGCTYSLADTEINNGYVFWFCDQCGEYLNHQKGFDKYAFSHVCTKCGYRNDTTKNNISDDKKDYKKILKKIAKGIGLVALGAATVTIAIVNNLSKDTDDDYDKLGDNDNSDDDFPFYSNGYDCMNCGQPLSGGIRVDAWENGNNSDPYVVCPHCRSTNFMWDD